MRGTIVALGGNALHAPGGEGSWVDARRRMRSVAPMLADVARARPPLVITHGNGPQVGTLLRQNELAASEIPRRPLDTLVAETQGQIGYLVQSEVGRAFHRARLRRGVLTVVSRMEVRRDDPAFRHPSKPVGRYYSEAEARVLRKQFGWSMVDDRSRGGWRRLVPSPRPVRWLEGETVSALLGPRAPAPWVPIVAGGGGIPVVQGRSGEYEGVEAVLDKDLAAALVGRQLGLDTLAIVTDVPGAAVSFGRSGERWLHRVSRRELADLTRAGEFAEGSMGPKVEAGLSFLATGGRRFVICDIPSLPRALRGEAGTYVTS